MERLAHQLGVGTLSFSQREQKAVLDVLQSNRLSYGQYSREFEQKFAALHDRKHAVFVNSGTSALCIALACLKEREGWEEGSEILVPSLTFVATINVILEQGLKPVFIDCDPRTYNMDPKNIEEKITSKTRAIMVVHLFGLVADMDPILEIANRHGLKMIEDSCQTLGVNYKGRKTGSFGDISCFSTYATHIITTGVGGLALTNDEKDIEIMRSLANHGRDSAYFNIDDDKGLTEAELARVIERRFKFVRHGYSFRITEMEAALGVCQLKKLPEILSSRQKNAATLHAGLCSYEHFLQLPWFDPSLQEHAYMLFPIVIREDAPFTKREMLEHLEQWNIETRDMMPLINQPVYRHLDIENHQYPVADWVNTLGFCIGCHQGFKEQELRYILDVFETFLSVYSDSMVEKPQEKSNLLPISL